MVRGELRRWRVSIYRLDLPRVAKNRAQYSGGFLRKWAVQADDPSDLNGKGNEVLIELLELANEGIERVN